MCHASGQAALYETLWEPAALYETRWEPAALYETRWEPATDPAHRTKGESCSVKTVARPSSALNHYYIDSEVHFCSMRPAQILVVRTGCIAKAGPALISHI
jgi:hypothetical protein